MRISSRTFLNAAPYAAFSALVFFLFPHAYDEKGRTPPVWPDWTWLDAIASGIVWISAAALLATVDRRRRAGGKAVLNTDKQNYEFHVLAVSALKATGFMWIIAVIRWIVPGSIWGSRAEGMTWFSLDSGEYQFLVGLWVLFFPIMGYEDIADIPGSGAGAPEKLNPLVSSGYNDPDWVALRHLLLEARVGRRVEVPEDLRTHPIAQWIDRYHNTGDPALLDQAAAELTGNTVDPWAVLMRGNE